MSYLKLSKGAVCAPVCKMSIHPFMHTSAIIVPSPYLGCLCKPVKPPRLISAKQVVMLKTNAMSWLTQLSVWLNVQPLQALVPSAATIMHVHSQRTVCVMHCSTCSLAVAILHEITERCPQQLAVTMLQSMHRRCHQRQCFSLAHFAHKCHHAQHVKSPHEAVEHVLY